MTPISVRYYVIHNKSKAITVIFMMSLIAIIYIGGLYLTNISKDAFEINDAKKDMIV